jgi:peptide deformylase
MKGLKGLLQIGNPILYQVSKPVKKTELPLLDGWVADLDKCIDEIRATYNFGRAIAAPQLGIMKRIIYVKLDKPLVIINPKLADMSEACFELWDDCMSLPNLLVKVKHHQSLTIKFRDQDWKSRSLSLENDLSELIQHEYDHLEGILCTMRAIDNKSFKWRN